MRPGYGPTPWRSAAPAPSANSLRATSSSERTSGSRRSRECLPGRCVCARQAARCCARVRVPARPACRRANRPPLCRIRRALPPSRRSEEHTSELQSRPHLVCRLLLEKKKKKKNKKKREKKKKKKKKK